MLQIWTGLTLLLLAQTIENPLFKEIQTDGISINGTTVKLLDPTLADGLDAEATRAALKTLAGDERAVQDLLRDSVTAPFILKTRDVKTTESTIRLVDVWFVIHAKLAEVSLDQVGRQPNESSFDAANMSLEIKFLKENDLRDRKVQHLPSLEGRSEWFTHMKGRLLDRIEVESTNRSVATRTADSILIATRTDAAFDEDPKFSNHWSVLTRNGAVETSGPSRKYGGSVSYAKISRLPGEGDAVLVESHVAFVEPTEWFQGNPILRSKFGVIAQDQIRRFRREIQKKRHEANLSR